MDVFISCSGKRSRAVAEALRNWLPKIINAIKPWLSSEDIAQGARWNAEIAVRLQAAKAGIICLTRSNLHADWILFEAGALSKTLENTFVCPLLIDLSPADLKEPLAQFQATRATKEGILKLTKTLNAALGEDALSGTHIDEAFDVWWPKLESQLKALPADEDSPNTRREDRELLEEILLTVRSFTRSQVRLIAPPPDGVSIKILSKSGEAEPLHTEVFNAIQRQFGPSNVDIREIGTAVMYSIQPQTGDRIVLNMNKNTPLAEVPERIRRTAGLADTAKALADERD